MAEAAPKVGTFAALRLRDFRLLLIGTTLSNAAQWIQQVTLGWLVYELTGSGTALGTINLVRSIAALGLAQLRDGRKPTAALFRRFARPEPRVSAGRWLADRGAAAMIDVSDGLAADAGHLADESGVGIALDAVPVAPGATLEDALGGGEDYELLFSMPAGREPPVGIAVGVCTDDPDERTLNGGPLPNLGWEHLL